jgi:ethanolamine utilization microcompartment shell protein EutL
MTGTSDGGGMNGAFPSDGEVLATVAGPAPIAATNGIEAVLISMATINR